MPNEAERIKHLTNRYEEICKHLQKVTSASNPSDSEFFKIIHNPGYTTLQDIELAAGVLEAIGQQAKAIESMNQALVNGARGGIQKAAA
jgi:hypothetical protein